VDVKILGIAGGTASGKTTTSRALLKYLGAQGLLIIHDRYYYSLPQEYEAKPTEYNFDHPDALETSRLVSDLQTLRQGRSVVLPNYDFSQHLRRPADEWDEVHPAPVIVVEGILVLADPALRKCFDFSVFVDAPDTVRFQRRFERDRAQRGRSAQEIQDQYASTVKPMHDEFVEPSKQYADRIIDGTGTTQAMVADVLALLGGE
jgi:uridine kinase